MNKVSLHLSACDSVFDPGLRLRPLELVMQRGTPRESKWKKKTWLLQSEIGWKWKIYQKIDGDE